MRELKAKLSRYLSVILMAAMVITGMPQATMAAVEETPSADSVAQAVEDDIVVGNEEVSQGKIEEVENVAGVGETFTVRFNATGDGEGFQLKEEDGTPINTTEVTVSANEKYSFMVFPGKGKKVDIVKAGETPLDFDGAVYTTRDNITADTQIDIVCMDVDYTIDFNTGHFTVSVNSPAVMNGAGTEATVSGYNDLFFSVTADDYYKVDSVSDNHGSLQPDAVTATYMVSKDTVISGNAAVTIATSRASYPIDFEGEDEVVVTKADGTTPLVIPAIVGINEGLTFAVKPKVGYELVSVSYNGAAVPVDGGVYSIATDQLVDGQKVIITTVEKNFQVSFNCVSDIFTDSGILYTDGDGNPDTKYQYNQSFSVQEGKTLRFKLNLDNAYENPVVKIDNAILTTGGDVYSHTITKETTISVTASKKPTVSFNILDKDAIKQIIYDIHSSGGVTVASSIISDIESIKAIPVPTGGRLLYSFELNEKYDSSTLSVKINGTEQTHNNYGSYSKTIKGGNTVIDVTAKVKAFDVTFENPTEAIIETISEASVPKVKFNDKTKKLEKITTGDFVRWKVTLSGNYVGRGVTMKTSTANGGDGNNIQIPPGGQGESNAKITDNTTIKVLPDVKYTFTNSGNAITFSYHVNDSYANPQTGSPNAAVISQNNITSDTDYFFKVTPDSGKTIDYVTIGGKKVTAVAQDGNASIYKVNAQLDTAIDVKSETAYSVTFKADNGAVAKVGKDKEDKNYSETLSDNDIKVLAGAQEFKFKVQAADSHKITSVSVNGATTTVLTADKDGVYTLTKDVVMNHPTVTIQSEKQKHKVTFYNAQRAVIKYEIGGTVSEESTTEIIAKKETVKDVVAGTTFMVEAPEGSHVMKVVKGEDKTATVMTPDAAGIYTIDSLNADDIITVTCKNYATGIKYNKEILSENEIEQNANTKVIYKMDITGVDRNFNPSKDLSIGYKIRATDARVDLSKVDYNTINVRVTTPYDYSGDETADIVFDIKEGDTVLTTFKVISTIPELKAPSVAVSDIRDNSAVLTLKDNNKQAPNVGRVYYHISATKQVSDDQIPIDLAALNEFSDGFEVQGSKDIYVLADATSKKFTTEVKVNFREPVGEHDLAASKGYNVSINTCISKAGGVNKVLDDSTSTVLKKKFDLSATKYETNLRLRKIVPNYMSGQAGVPLAKVTWSRGTTYREFDYVKVYSGDGSDFYSLSNNKLKIKNDIIYLNESICLNRVGTYTVEAQPKSKHSNVKATTLKFKVVQGIYKLDSANKNVSILRTKGKTVTYQLPALIYNEGDPHNKPTSKMVTYTLSRVNELNPSVAAPLTDNDKLIKVKKDKITIHKDYVFDAEHPVTYKVTVKANDFKQNNTKMEYTFKIKETGATSLKYLYICEFSDYQYKPVNTNAALGNREYYIIATKSEVKGEIAFNSVNIIRTDEYSLKCSNSEVKVSSDDGYPDDLHPSPDWEGYAYLVQPEVYAKDVTFTATVLDGSKTNISRKKVTFEEYPDDLWFDVFTNINTNAKADKTRTISVLNNEIFTIHDYAKIADQPKEIFPSDSTNSLMPRIDYKVKADKGLKVVSDVTGKRTVLFTGKKLSKDGKATGSLTYTYYKLVKGQRTKATKVLTIVNTNKWITTVAPSATQRNTLYAVRTSPQLISFNVAKKLPAAANMVRITKVVGNENSSYNYLYSNSNLDTDILIKNRMFSLSLVTYDSKNYGSETYTYPVDAGTYKYIITYGHKVGTKFVEDTGATTLTIKVKKETAKVAASYTMSEVVPNDIISGKYSKGTAVSGAQLLNANMNGILSRFTDYFTLSADGKSIELKAAKGIANAGNPGIDTEIEAKRLHDTIAYLTNKANKNDLVGYLAYDFENSNLTDTKKITVKIKTNAKSANAFKAGKKTISVSGGDIKLKYNGKDTKYAYAYTDAYQGAVSLNAAVDNKGNVIISGEDTDVKGSVRNAYVYVLKTDSPYVAYIKKLNGEAKIEAMIEYGVKVKLGTIKVR